MKKEQKLRILCLHGYNTNKKVMEYQTRHFQKMFGEVIELDYLEGPYQAIDPIP